MGGDLKRSLVRPAVTDDDGSGTNGTVLNAAFFNQLLDYIDAKVAEAVKASSDAELAAEDAQTYARNARRAMNLKDLGE
jgi:hypothetical protein